MADNLAKITFGAVYENAYRIALHSGSLSEGRVKNAAYVYARWEGWDINDCVEEYLNDIDSIKDRDTSTLWIGRESWDCLSEYAHEHGLDPRPEVLDFADIHAILSGTTNVLSADCPPED